MSWKYISLGNDMHRRGPNLQANSPPEPRAAALAVIGQHIAECTLCPGMVGKPVPGPPVLSRILLLGQAPGPHEEAIGQPFAWTAGRTLFKWLQTATGAPESVVRERVYFAAVARCFPGKAKGGGDRKPSREEADVCGAHLAREVALLAPTLILPVGTLAIERVFGSPHKLVDLVGQSRRVTFYGLPMDAIALPHPSGLSTWPRTEPGASLLAEALNLVSNHPAVKEAFA